MPSLDRVLRAAVRSMIHGRHVPHCFSAHVIGQGYVNRGGPPYDRADYLRQLEQRATAEVENMGFAPRYASEGEEQPKKGILFADWNVLPRNLDRTLERLGYAVEWSDEWTTCDDCGAAVRTQPDSFVWTPDYSETEDGAVVCKDCQPEEDDNKEEEEE